MYIYFMHSWHNLLIYLIFLGYMVCLFFQTAATFQKFFQCIYWKKICVLVDPCRSNCCSVVHCSSILWKALWDSSLDYWLCFQTSFFKTHIWYLLVHWSWAYFLTFLHQFSCLWNEGDNNSTYLTSFLWGLNKFIVVKQLEQCRVSKCLLLFCNSRILYITEIKYCFEVPHRSIDFRSLLSKVFPLTFQKFLIFI